ncbi:MAG: hypothetical protein ACLTT1_07925 [[Clostridium] scindens]
MLDVRSHPGTIAGRPPTKRAVIQDIKDFAPATIELVLWAGFPSILVALYLGVTSAQHKNKWQDYLCRF